MIGIERGTHMKNNVLNVVEDTSIALGVAVSINTIYTYLGILVLVFQIGLIVYKITKSIVEHAKKKQFDKIDDDIQRGIDELQDVVNKDGEQKK